jgi:ubiquinone/menaquinone biosynthesis C-methylase UbiE
MDDINAEIWDQRNSGEGEAYKRYITDPLIIELAKPICGKVVLEQGCGNGHLARKLARENPAKVVLLDFYEGNLECARRNLESLTSQFMYVQADLNKPLDLESLSIDIVTSSMVLSEIDNLHKAIQETYRILNFGGVYVFTVIHPTYIFKRYLQEKQTGKPNKKVIPARSYFDRERSAFILGVETHAEIRAPHYNRTVQDYIDVLLSAGFSIERILEPELNEELLRVAPRFSEDLDCPISLIVKAAKAPRGN